MVFLLNKKAVEENRTPDSKIRSPAFRLFGAVGTRNPVGPVATVFPEFIARDGREPVDGGRQGGKRQVGAARRRSRGHGLARLDGTRPRATVAMKVMESGKTAGQGNGPSTRRPHGKRSAQARSWKPGRRRQPSEARERWKPEGAKPRRGFDAQHDSATARPAISQGAGDARVSAWNEQQSHDKPAPKGVADQ